VATVLHLFDVFDGARPIGGLAARLQLGSRLARELLPLARSRFQHPGVEPTGRAATVFLRIN